MNAHFHIRIRPIVITIHVRCAPIVGRVSTWKEGTGGRRKEGRKEGKEQRRNGGAEREEWEEREEREER